MLTNQIVADWQTATRGPLTSRPGGVPNAPVSDGRVLNAMSVDVEEYFQVSGFERTVARDRWPAFESRVVASTDRLLQLFDDAGVRSTFFVLGWVAERFPALVRRIQDAGHELASHGYAHELVYAIGPKAFREDLRRARRVLEDAAGVPIVGYRAPSYSITRDSLWALDVLVEEGYIYDSSIYPIHHDRYGIPGWQRHIHRVDRPLGGIWELPGSTLRFAGANLPIGGGGYFRLLPYAWTRLGFQRLNLDGHSGVFYLHPWEVDPDQPRLTTTNLSSFRHYTNLHQTEDRLRRLLNEFQFGTVSDVLDRVVSAGQPALA